MVVAASVHEVELARFVVTLLGIATLKQKPSISLAAFSVQRFMLVQRLGEALQDTAQVARVHPPTTNTTTMYLNRVAVSCRVSPPLA
jgi:hypothetical protein